MSFYQKVEQLSPIALQSAAPEKYRSSTSFGDVLRVAVGAALGYGAARGAGSVLGLPEDKSNALALGGAALGGLVGLSKTSESKLAFRASFLKAAIESGHFKTAFTKKAYVWPLVLAPLTGLSQTAKRVGTQAGSVLGAADAPDDTDADIVRIKVETELLRQELARVRAMKQTQALKELLAKRRG